MKKNILILGGGFGGLEVATGLRANLDDNYKITLIDKNDFFIIGFSKFDLMFWAQSSGRYKGLLFKIKKEGNRFCAGYYK